ncbi:hypothetical protein [Terriglobus saanensis]|nr:hypothetical protein [Terriglobus saanensis]
MTPETLYRLAPPLIALQLLAFGWSVNREIHTKDADRQIVITLPDVINIMSLFATVGCLIVLPLATESYLWLSRIVLACAYVLIAFHPLTIAAHYGLWKRKSGSEHATEKTGFRYVTREERTTSLVSALLVVVVAMYLGTH